MSPNRSEYIVRRAIATYWFNEQRAGDITANKQRRLIQWLCQTPENRAAYQQMERDWARLGIIAGNSKILAARQDDRHTFGL